MSYRKINNIKHTCYFCVKSCLGDTHLFNQYCPFFTIQFEEPGIENKLWVVLVMRPGVV